LSKRPWILKKKGHGANVPSGNSILHGELWRFQRGLQLASAFAVVSSRVIPVKIAPVYALQSGIRGSHLRFGSSMLG
jgi:hypothetical protein